MCRKCHNWFDSVLKDTVRTSTKKKCRQAIKTSTYVLSWSWFKLYLGVLIAMIKMKLKP